ncbi:MAG: TIGR02221 family CRISPR-associated protein, partial [Bryobacteraceae bacterium]
MALVQISFLGKVAQGQDGYVRTRYGFPDSDPVEAAFFGFALADRIRPARLAVLGTTGSMWHTLLELASACGREDAIFRALEDGCRQDSTTQDDLERAAQMLGEKLGLEVRLVLIPYGRTAEEQLETLARIADQVDQGDEVALDVTHGLRHLPMLALLSALLLRSIRGATIRGVYYGAFDMRESGVAPVLDLKGLLAIGTWAQAVARFEADGDYGA